MSSQTLPERVEIREKDEKTITDCPPEIGKQLQRAAFDEISANEYQKTRETRDGDRERPIVTAEVDGDTLRLSVEDVVGVVDLTPSSKLQINPKIGWEDILEMFLSVREANRSLEYQGVPIKDFLADDVSIEDVFVVVAVNYLNALEPLHRHGFMRSFETTRYDAVTGRGRIDIERSILNLERGQAKQHYVRKDIDYATPENQLIYAAGKRLLFLFQNAGDEYVHKQFYTIFSEVREAVRRLEDLGISAEGLNLREVQSLDTGSLPRQRAYYRDAVRTAKTILSSATGQSLASGREELTVDFILNMESLFEEFTQVALESELRNINDSPLYETFEGASIEDEPTLSLYADSTSASYRPDHILCEDDEPIAILDSKYYARGKDPSLDSDARSRMFSYGYVLNVDHLVFCCPFGESDRRYLSERDAVVDIIRPGGDFSISAYRQSLREFIRRKLADGGGEPSPLQEDLAEEVCLKGVSIDGVEDIAHTEELQTDGSPSNIARRKVLSKAIDFSNYVNGKRHVSNYRKVVLKLKQPLIDYDEYDMAIPFLKPPGAIPEDVYGDRDPDEVGDHEAVKYYFIKTANGQPEDISDPVYVVIEW